MAGAAQQSSPSIVRKTAAPQTSDGTLELGSNRLFELDGDAERIAELEADVTADSDLLQRLASDLQLPVARARPNGSAVRSPRNSERWPCRTPHSWWR